MIDLIFSKKIKYWNKQWTIVELKNTKLTKDNLQKTTFLISNKNADFSATTPDLIFADKAKYYPFSPVKQTILHNQTVIIKIKKTLSNTAYKERICHTRTVQILQK